MSASSPPALPSPPEGSPPQQPITTQQTQVESRDQPIARNPLPLSPALVKIDQSRKARRKVCFGSEVVDNEYKMKSRPKRSPGNKNSTLMLSTTDQSPVDVILPDLIAGERIPTANKPAKRNHLECSSVMATLPSQLKAAKSAVANTSSKRYSSESRSLEEVKVVDNLTAANPTAANKSVKRDPLSDGPQSCSPYLSKRHAEMSRQGPKSKPSADPRNAIPPLVPNAPTIRRQPPAPRPARLPTPDLPDIDGAMMFGPQPGKRYNPENFKPEKRPFYMKVDAQCKSSNQTEVDVLTPIVDAAMEYMIQSRRRG
jgi:hypothetical protein